MKSFCYSMLAVLIASAGAVAAAGVPTMQVTVSDSAGKVAYKGSTTANGTFSTPVLAPGNYVVQFTSGSSAVKGNHFALVTSAGKKKVMAEAVAGEKFAAGGVAMRIEVGKGLNITGQVSSGKTANVAAEGSSNAKVKIVNGKRYVWVGPETGSNMGGRWVEEGSPAANNVRRISREGVQQMQEQGQHGLGGQ